MMIRPGYYLIICLALFNRCAFFADDAQSIIDKTIEAHGGELFENSIIAFDFRNRHYILERNSGRFIYHRIFEDSAGTYHDILDNNGFKRFLNDREIAVDSRWAKRYSNSINSVAYFALLPFGLNDPAVNKSMIGEEEIKGTRYYKVKVTFDQEGGGEDHEDVFVYWIGKDNFRMDYFGYSYVTDGGGNRLREAVNQREIHGLLLSDYHNYKGPEELEDVAGLMGLFRQNKLDKLSEIRLENLEVKRYR